MSFGADNLSYIENSDGTWHATADLTLPDGSTSGLDETIQAQQHVYYKGVLAKIYASNYIAGYGALTPQSLVAWITAQPGYTASPPTMTMLDVEAYIQSQTTTEIADGDVARLLALVAIGEQFRSYTAPSATTTITPPPISG